MPEVNFFISFSFCLKVSLYAFWFWYNTWGGKGLFHLASLREARAGAQGRSLGAGTVADHGEMLLSGSPPHSSSATFLI